VVVDRCLSRRPRPWRAVPVWAKMGVMRSGPGRRVWRWAVACAVIAAVVLVLADAFIWHGGLSTAASAASVIAIIFVFTPVLTWARKTSRPAVDSTPQQVAEAAQYLAGKVREQWLTEIRIRRLHDPDPVAVKWRLTDRAVGDMSLNVAARSKLPFAASADHVAKLAEAFRTLDRRRLVIIGEPGMGKTTLAALLLMRLLEPVEGASRPVAVPVLFSLSSFDPGPGRDTVESWLARRLGEDYPGLRAVSYGKDATAALVRQRLILPILDGLDELPESARPEAITSLNHALADGELGLILTCRTEAYTTAVATGDTLRAAAVIEADPLGPAEASSYLASIIPRHSRQMWEPILDCLRKGSTRPLAKALDTPLMLWLIRQVYLDARRDPGELADAASFPHPGVIQAHLLQAVIPALITANPPDPYVPGRPRHAWNVPHAQRWLGYLAYHLNRLETRDLAWWQLRAATSRWQLRFALAGLTASPPYANFSLRGRTKQLLDGMRKKLRTFAACLVVGLMGGLQTVFIGRHRVGLEDSFILGIALGLVFGFFVAGGEAVLELAKQPTGSARVITPIASLRNNRRLLVLSGLGTGLAFGLMIAALGTAIPALTTHVAADFVLYFIIGLVVGLGFGIPYRWPGYAIAKTQLWRRRLVPWRLMSFLNDAHRLGILLQVGAAYQFRHAALQDHLAATYEQASTPTQQIATARR
jgi:hypothetical protein